MDDIDAIWESMRRHGLIDANEPPLTDRRKAAIRKSVAKARPMTEAQKAQLLRLLGGGKGTPG